MSVVYTYGFAGVALWGLGLFGVLWIPHLLRKVLALNVMGSGIFLLLLALSKRPPYQTMDPVPSAMILTGLVVSISTTALALTLIRKWYQNTKTFVLAQKPPPSSEEER